MVLETIAYVVFFLAYGVSTFFPFKYSREIAGAAAIVVGVLMLVRY